ncbi:basic salivary proline-rich protein 1-like [Micropterus salmoides]|uniref:basic salivary proline-rich protein 1-like n=1 Tax=Micropterus salmoides TaxID=27706 RepID=UPI0018EE3F83|nr:basic salivary proline-rich protein 1-like [Micropterus salmoides]
MPSESKRRNLQKSGTQTDRVTPTARQAPAYPAREKASGRTQWLKPAKSPRSAARAMVHPPLKVHAPPPNRRKSRGPPASAQHPSCTARPLPPCNANQTSNDATTNHPSPPAQPEASPPRVQAEPAAPELRRPEACPGPVWGPSPPSQPSAKEEVQNPPRQHRPCAPGIPKCPHCESKSPSSPRASVNPAQPQDGSKLAQPPNAQTRPRPIPDAPNKHASQPRHTGEPTNITPLQI